MHIHQSGYLQSVVIVRKCIQMADKDRISILFFIQASGSRRMTTRCDNRLYAKTTLTIMMIENGNVVSPVCVTLNLIVLFPK